MSTENDHCQNCEKPYKSGFKFCPHCGQKTNDELTLGVLFYNTISNYFSFDARFLKSFIPLMFKPGYLAKEFIKGKRLLYLHPAQMYLFVAVIFFFIFNFYVREGREELDKNMQDVLASRTEKLQKQDSVSQDSLDMKAFLQPLQDANFTKGLDEKGLKTLDSISNVKIPKKNIDSYFSFDEVEMDSLISSGASDEEIYKAMGLEEDAGYFTKRIYSQGLKFYKTMGFGQVYQTFIDSIPLAMFFLLPIFAFLLKLFFYKRGRYSHHLVFGFYYFSFLFTLFSIILAINYWVYDIPNRIDVILALSTFFYLLFAIIKFYGQNWFVSFIKSGVVSFLFLLIVLPFSFTILGIIAFLFY